MHIKGTFYNIKITALAIIFHIVIVIIHISNDPKTILLLIIFTVILSTYGNLDLLEEGNIKSNAFVVSISMKLYTENCILCLFEFLNLFCYSYLIQNQGFYIYL